MFLLLTRRAHLQAFWMVSSKVSPLIYRVVFVNGCEESVLKEDRKKRDTKHTRFRHSMSEVPDFPSPVWLRSYFQLGQKEFRTYLQRDLSERTQRLRQAHKHNRCSYVFYIHSLCWGPAPSQMFLWCPCWQRWRGCQCRSVWSCGMWRSSEGPPEREEKSYYDPVVGSVSQSCCL